MAAEVRLEKDIEPYLRRSEYLQVAEFLARERTQRDIQDRVAKQIKRASSKPSPIHDLIVSIPFAGIITTNYDLLLTQADKKVFFNLPITHQNTGLRNQIHEHFLLHLHGHINEPETIVLSRKSYDEIELKNSKVRSFLSGVFQNFIVLFIGFGFADVHIDDFLREFKETDSMGDSSVFALITTPSPDTPDRVRDQNLRFRYVNPIYLVDRGDYGVGEICSWLEALRDGVKQISSSIAQSTKTQQPIHLIDSLRSLFISDEWFPPLLNSLATLPNRPDVANLLRIGFTKADVDKLFSRLSPAEMRSILIYLNSTNRSPLLEDALSCFPP